LVWRGPTQWCRVLVATSRALARECLSLVAGVMAFIWVRPLGHPRIAHLGQQVDSAFVGNHLHVCWEKGRSKLKVYVLVYNIDFG
jgi:hypothetical protein